MTSHLSQWPPWRTEVRLQPPFSCANRLLYWGNEKMVFNEETDFSKL